MVDNYGKAGEDQCVDEKRICGEEYCQFVLFRNPYCQRDEREEDRKEAETEILKGKLWQDAEVCLGENLEVDGLVDEIEAV